MAHATFPPSYAPLMLGSEMMREAQTHPNYRGVFVFSRSKVPCSYCYGLGNGAVSPVSCCHTRRRAAMSITRSR